MENDAIYSLANAVIKLAAKDYMKALKQLEKHPMYKPALQEKQELEKFFRSGWYRMLTKVDPEYLIQQLQKEVWYDRKRIIRKNRSTTKKNCIQS